MDTPESFGNDNPEESGNNQETNPAPKEGSEPFSYRQSLITEVLTKYEEDGYYIMPQLTPTAICFHNPNKGQLTFVSLEKIVDGELDESIAPYITEEVKESILNGETIFTVD